MSYYSDKINEELLDIADAIQSSINYIKNDSYQNREDVLNKMLDAIAACKRIVEITDMMNNDI